MQLQAENNNNNNNSTQLKSFDSLAGKKDELNWVNTTTTATNFNAARRYSFPHRHHFLHILECDYSKYPVTDTAIK